MSLYITSNDINNEEVYLALNFAVGICKGKSEFGNMSDKFKNLCIKSIAPLALCLWMRGSVTTKDNKELFTKFFEFFDTSEYRFLLDISKRCRFWKQNDKIVTSFSKYYRGIPSDYKRESIKHYLSKYEKLTEIKMLAESIEYIEYHKCSFP